MAGKPDTQRRMELLDGVHAVIMEYVEAGESMRRIAVRISDLLEEPISEALIGRWLQKPENEQEASRARERAADLKAERVVDAAETLVRDVQLGLAGRDDIAAHRHAAEQDKWIVGIWNRKYAPQTAATVTVNVGAIHLDSLRQQPAVAAHRPLALQAFDVSDVECNTLGTTGHVTLADLL